MARLPFLALGLLVVAGCLQPGGDGPGPD
ncbi:MAG: hypothetical protein QOJ26_822, partial [Thermoplasmata archaeon]|nr:hypothetical protein [Thermoplasmata archaeon]